MNCEESKRGMRIVVFGLGHVGTVTIATLLRSGHTVVGVDTDEGACERMKSGSSRMREPDVAEVTASALAAGKLTVTTNAAELGDADMAFVCVGTHGLADGKLDLSAVQAVARHLGAAVRRRVSQAAPLLMVFRSTLPPGAMRNVVLPAVTTAVGEPPGRRYDVVYYPAFPRVGSALTDEFAPTRLVIGEWKPGSAQRLLALYDRVDTPIFAMPFEAAELSKLADNAFHALKVVFANEIGRYAVHSGISPDDVFDQFEADTRLNLSASYLRPGGAFGGPCLPKDVTALAAQMSEAGIATPVIGGILGSNSSHTEFLVAEIARRVAPPARILLVGLSFKSGTDDVRGSPFVGLAELLLDRGFALSIYDPDLLGHTGVSAPLPPRVAAAMRAEISTAEVWDLVVMGKENPEILQRLGPNRALFPIYRL